jgi:hypothetical protein
MVGRGKGLVKLMQEEETEGGNDSLIHQEKLYSALLTAEGVLTVFVRVASLIRSQGLNHKEFQDLLNRLETEYNGIVCCSAIRCLSDGKMFKEVFDLKREIETFL